MPTLDIVLDLLESNSQIEYKILRGFVEDINAEFSRKIPSIKQRLNLETVSYLQSTDTYLSLINGDLAGHFGLPIESRKSMVDNILRTIGDHIQVLNNPFVIRNKNISGGIEINVLLADFSDIIDMAEAFVHTEKGQDLPWLSWLLKSGTAIIISTYEYQMIGGWGRSHRGIMIKENAGIWRVPTDFAGTINDNWLTKAIATKSGPYFDIIGNILKEELM